MSVEYIITTDDFRDFTKTEKAFILFSANWSDESKQIITVFEDLAKIDVTAKFGVIDAEVSAEVAKLCRISAVPTVLYLQNGKISEVIHGLNIGAITSKCKTEKIPLKERMEYLIHKSYIMVFIKGDRFKTRCGFSNQLIEIMNDTQLPYETFDILSDEEVRQGLKELSDWPTYPQVYVNGEFIGGLDIIKELRDTNALLKTLEEEISGIDDSDEEEIIPADDSD